MSETEQQSITDQETFGATIDAVDVEHLAAALEPMDAIVDLEFDHNLLEAATSDFVNVIATRVRKPIDAPHAETITVDSNDLADAVDSLRWAEDECRLEVHDDELWIFDGDDHRRAFESIDRKSPNDTRSKPKFDSILEETDWRTVASCEAWEFAGLVRTVAAPATNAVRLRPEQYAIRAEGDDREFDDDAEEQIQTWPYMDRANVEFVRYEGDDVECRLTDSYLTDLVGALPITGETELEIWVDTSTPLYVRSDAGVEFALAPRRGDVDE